MANNIKLDVNADVLVAHLREFQVEAKKAIEDGVKNLSAIMYTKAQELASNKLKTTAEKYKKALSQKEISEGIWMVSLDESALFIEEGMKCVVYGKNPKHIPKIMTLEGEIPITKLQIGHLVLNQFGKWTKVLKIHEEHLVENSKMAYHKIEASGYFPGRKRFHKRIHTIFHHLECTICGHSTYNAKLRNKERTDSYCQECFKKELLVIINIPGGYDTKSPKLTKSAGKLVLTQNHKVMTQNGWVEARNLQNTDILMMPSWNRCKTCNKPTPCYYEFCKTNHGASGCFSSFLQKQLLKEGRHISQEPGWMVNIYSKIIKNTGRVSGAEDAVAGLLAKAGFSSVFEGKGEARCIRQYRIKGSLLDRLNRPNYYFIDFYIPELNLGIEVDGKVFHDQIKDEFRDKHIKSSSGIDIIRIPAKKVRNKDFYKETIIPLLSNHSGDITFVSIKDCTIEKFYPKQYSGLTRKWDITVEYGESFVCEKILIHNSGSMVESLLKTGYKVSRDGVKYRSIPFEYSGQSKNQSQNTQSLVNAIKSEMRERKIPFKKIEYDASGSPRIGKIHSFDIESKKPSPNSKSPALHGVTISQAKNATTGKVEQKITTFRTVSEKSSGWVHPGLEAKNILDESLEYAEDFWERTLLPEIMAKFDK